MGLATLLLGCGDAFHLVPRVLNYFVDADFTAALGIGKLVTSITMTIFYVLLYHVFVKHYKVQENRKLTYCVYALALIRIVLCLFPQNRWFDGEGSRTWGIYRNLPFVAMGLVTVGYLIVCYRAWLIAELVMASFACYMGVVLYAHEKPMMGMLMIPKTICYIWMIALFLMMTAA